MNSIMTNKVVFHKSYDDIDKNYDIICLKTDSNYFKFNSSIFDLPLLNKNVRSVLYSSNNIFLLIKKASDNLSIVMDGLREVKEADKISGTIVSSGQLKDHQLLQLLLNSIWNFNSDELKSNNVTGHLYCFRDKWCYRGLRELKDDIIQVSSVEIIIDPDMHINLPVRTFSSEKIKGFIRFGKTKYEDHPKYILNNNQTMSRKLYDDQGPEYIIRNPMKKRELPFLDLSSYRDFNNSKMGVLYQTIEKFNSVFKNIASIELHRIPLSSTIESRRPEINRKESSRQLMFLNRGLNIVDLANDDESENMIQGLKDTINELLSDDDSLFSLNVSESKSAVQDKLNIIVLHEKDYYDITDPYSDRFEGCAVQHLTIEKFKKNSKHIVQTTINELLVKDDILNNKMTLFNWKSLNKTGDMLFITKSILDEETVYNYMVVHQDGSFDLFARKNFDKIDQYTKYQDYFMYDEHIECLAVDDKENIVSIWDTGWITVPEIDEIAKHLKEGNTKLKGKQKRKDLLEAVIDINTIEYEGKIYYYVGVIGDGMKSKIAHASHIRKYEMLQGTTFDIISLVKTIDTQFVKNGQFTVLPFPFKYLNEYINTQQN